MAVEWGLAEEKFSVRRFFFFAFIHVIRIQMHCFIDHNIIDICLRGALLNNYEKGQGYI